MEHSDNNLTVEYLLEKEGGRNTAGLEFDRGGDTIYGISQKFNPRAWENGPPSLEQARLIWLGEGPDHNGYLAEWKLDRFPQKIANKLTDLLCPRNILMEAIQVLQRAVWAVSGIPLKVDGVAGPITMKRVTDQCLYVSGELMLLACLRCEIAAQYRLLVARNPSQQPNERGWLNRSYS